MNSESVNKERHPDRGEAQAWSVKTHALTRIYGRGELQVRALIDVDLRIAPGEFVAIMGPSGSGKSTLLNMLGALDRPSAGRVWVAGQDLSKVRDLGRFRSQTVGFVFQLHNLIPTLTALENVTIPMVGQQSRRQRTERAHLLLEQVGLAGRAGHLPGAMSGGERQRVAVARALANAPAVILADEPTGNLDSASGQELIRLLREINATQQTTFLIVTHDPNIARQTDRVVVMQDGRIVREDNVGSPLHEDLKMWHYSRLGQQIMNGNLEDLKGIVTDDEERRAIASLLQRIDDFS
jgi:ABC-type lipoprotein export system ATPase subunit